MALTRDFKVKDSLSVGISGLFRAGETLGYNPSKIAIDTYGKILSGGRDLATAFANITLASLTNGPGINTFSYNGGSTATVTISGASSLTNGSLVQWSGTGFANSTLTDASLLSLRNTTNTLSGRWESSYTSLNSLSSKYDSNYATTNTLSSKWDSNYTSTNILSAKWDSNYTTTNTNSANWSSAYTTTNTNSASWSNVYSTYNAASGTILNNINATAVQGQLSATELDGGSITRNLTNLGTTGTPTFASLTATGLIKAGSFAGDGSSLTNVTATPTFPGSDLTDLASGNFIFVNNDSAFGAVSGNRRITYSNLLTDLVGNNTGLAVAADSDGIVFKNLAGLAGNTVTLWDIGNGQLANSIITQSGSTVTVGGALTANGNFGVTGNTVLGDASGDSVTINAGTVTIPNATNSSALVIGGDTNLYRSAADVLRTDDTLIVGGNLSAFGSVTLGDNPSADSLTINANVVNLASGSVLTFGGDTNIYRDSGGNALRTDDSLIVGGNTTITGNLSVLGDVTQINTLVSVTSALSVINTGSGPAIYVEQSGPQPIAQFVDAGGTAITFTDAGSVGIGLPVFSGSFTPAEKLTVSGSISANGTLKLGGIAAGTTNSVVIESSGTLQNRAINPGVWNTTAAFVSGSSTRTLNTVSKFADATGVTNSTITDDGNNVTIGGNIILTPTHRVKHYAESGDQTLFIHTAVFSRSLSSAGSSNIVTTFDKTDLKSSKYSITLFTGSNRTAFEVLAVYDGVSTAEGTVYAIVDAQGSSLLTNVDVIVGATTIELSITPSLACTAFIKGEAYVDDNT